MKTKIIDTLVFVLFLTAVGSCIYLKSERHPDLQCYGTCHQFESALLTGCYITDFEGRHEPDARKRHNNFLAHEEYCREQVKMFMGAESGCPMMENK